MQSKTRVFITLFILVGIIFGIYIFSDWFSRVTGYILGSNKEVELARCLQDKGAVLYTASDCSDCYKQEQALGDDFLSIVSSVSCTKESCSGLKELPAWEIDGKFYYGLKNLKELNNISGCLENENDLS